jgi:dihydrofolate synthase/folylpolyglutamate synthase
MNINDPIEEFLNRLQHPLMAGIDLSLDRMARLLAAMGNPQKRLPPVVHVAGTNGKGSLIAYLAAIFEAAGLRVHRYTSPHLVWFRERIVLSGKEIENADLEKLFRHISPILAREQATFFEAATAAAFLAFADKPADILLLETGMGGRLDATNVIAKPLLTAITPIALDHTEYLGKTIEKIAAEKAGIIKRAVPLVVGRQCAEALKVLEAKAASLNAPISRFGLEWRVENHKYISPTKEIELAPSLTGEHQFDNAGTVVACVEQMPQFNISDEHIKQGLAGAFWQARLQHLTDHPYTKLLPTGAQLWLDGGHNPQGGQVLGEWLSEQAKTREIYLICGMMKGKDSKEFLQFLAPHVKGLLAIAIPREKDSQNPENIMNAARAVEIEAQSAEDVEKALQTIASHAKNNAIICICGSLYLAGKILAKV